MASGPWDNVQLAGPPNGPAYINAGMNAAQTLGNLVNSGFNAYRQGQDFQYQQQQRNFFQDPNNQAMLQQALQNGNYAPLLQGIIQQGGTSAASQMLPTLIQSGASRSADQLAWGQPGNQQPVNTGPATNSSASGHENIHGNFSQPRIPVSQPNNFGTGSDEGADTVRSLVAGLAGGKPVSNAAINNYAKSLGVSPDADLSEDQAARAQSIISNSLAKQGIGTPTPNRGGINNVQRSGTDEQDVGKSTAKLAVSNELKPSSVQGGPPISPAPTSGSGKTRSATPPPSAIAGDGLEDRRNIRNAQAQPNFDQRFGGAPTEAEIQKYETSGNNKLKASTTFGLSKEKATGLRDAGNKDLEIAKQLREQRFEANKPTEKAKDLASGATKQGLQAAEDSKYYSSLHRGLVGTGMIAAQQKQNIDMLRQVANAPSFAPGSGSDLWLAYQRAAASLGINPTGAAPREVFNQVAARILADQFSGMRSMAAETGEAGSRVFKSMLDIEEKANITPEDSLEGIKAKLDILDKTGNLMLKWANLADQYKGENGGLDAKFDSAMRADIAKARVQNVVPKATPTGPPAGHVEGGYRFKGGNPNDKNNWVPISAGDRT